MTGAVLVQYCCIDPPPCGGSAAGVRMCACSSADSSARPHVTRGLSAVDRTLSACPSTCTCKFSFRHLTSHLPYISTHFHSLLAHIGLLPFRCVLGLSRLRAWGSYEESNSAANSSGRKFLDNSKGLNVIISLLVNITCPWRILTKL